MAKKDIEEIIVNEGSEIRTMHFSWYVIDPETTKFSALLENGEALPKGVICSGIGDFGGTPELGTARDTPYVIFITAEDEEGNITKFKINLRILKQVVLKGEEEILVDSRIDLGDYWDKFSEDIPLPDLKSILTREISDDEIYHLFQKFATLTVYNADNYELEENGKLINLPKASKKYNVYDFGNALVATPIDLYDSKRTLKDAIKTSDAVIDEVNSRDWNIELAGLDKMVRAAWVKVQEINSSRKEPISVVGYNPTVEDYEVLEHKKSTAPTVG